MNTCLGFFSLQHSECYGDVDAFLKRGKDCAFKKVDNSR